MRRFANSLLLIALLLPYARAPLCQAGSHEHPASHHGLAEAFAAVTSEGPETAGDCHTLMACTVVLQASLVEAGPGFLTSSQGSDPSFRANAAPIRSRASPDTPPPRTA